MPFGARLTRQLLVRPHRTWIRGATRGRAPTRRSLSGSAKVRFSFAFSFADVPGVGLSSSAQNIAPEAHKHKEAQTCSPRLREAFAFFLCLVTLYRNSKSESQGKTTACANGLDAEAGKRCGRGISGFSREESWWRGEARVRRQDQRCGFLRAWESRAHHVDRSGRGMACCPLPRSAPRFHAVPDRDGVF